MSRLRAVMDALRQAARAMVGQNSYRAYCEHMAGHHPDTRPMDEASFFRQQQSARYEGNGVGRCC